MPTTTIIRIDVRASLQWNCFPTEGGHWIGVCDPLNLTVQSDTWTELMEDIGHTLDMMLKDLLKSNELGRFLRDHGWKTVGAIPDRSSKGIQFDVPFIPAMMKAPRGSQRAVH